MRPFLTLLTFLICTSLVPASNIISDQLLSGYKLAVAQNVFDRLIEAKGVKNMPPPHLKLVDSERNVAWCNSENAEIGLEEKAYDICISFGADSLNALAAILAHELIHYYEKHGWTEMFASDFSDLKHSTQVAALDQHLPQETQADYLGGFLAYAAGFNTLGLMPAFLEKVYRVYSFDEDMHGYPSLTDRKAMALTSLERCQELIQIFETANFLLALKDYTAAKRYYQYILNDFQSREMYNNLGIVIVQEAIEQCAKEELRFAYPLELDATSRLSSNTRGILGGSTSDQTQWETLLGTAIEKFETAIILDKNYTVAYLNLANTYALLKEDMDAEYYARKVIKMDQGKGKNVADAYVILGILAAVKEDTSTAVEYFDEAINMGRYFGSLNKQILQSPNSSLALHKETLDVVILEKIEDLSIDQLVVDLQRERLTPEVIVDIDPRTTFARVTGENSTVLIHLSPFDEDYMLLQLVNDNYTGTTNGGLGLGDNREEIIETYGNSDHYLQSTHGSYLIYFRHQIIFLLDNSDKVTQWGIFRRSN